MTLEELIAKIRKWDLQATNTAVANSKYSSIFDQLTYHALKEWRVYLPATDHVDINPSYLERLAVWVGNVTNEDDQKLLLEYALFISFFSHEDFAALYRTALNREIKRWVATQIGARLDVAGGNGFDALVDRQINLHTWFCPITDSMDINEFHKTNHIAGVSHHPGFAAQQMIAEHPTNPNPQLARDWALYMSNPSGDPQNPSPPLYRLVLLEDVVGSGTQCLNAVRWAVATLGVPVLFVPLILCPNGVNVLRAEEQRWNGRLTVCPVIELRRSDLLGPERQGLPGCPIAQEIEALVARCAPRASLGMDPFGYLNTGCSVATFSNTPDNTLPIVHNKPQGGNWEPLFPRVFRN